jgi:hypothetical protein
MENIQQGFAAFKQRIKPSLLAENTRNGQILGDWCRQNGYVIDQMTAQQIAEALFKAASDDNVITRLEWLTKPSKLRLLQDKGIRNELAASKEQNLFAENAKKAEVVKAYQEKQDAALRQINSLIESFQLGLHTKTDAVKQKARNYVAQAVKEKRDLQGVAIVVDKFIQDSYAEDERSRERM